MSFMPPCREAVELAAEHENDSCLAPAQQAAVRACAEAFPGVLYRVTTLNSGKDRVVFNQVINPRTVPPKKWWREDCHVFFRPQGSAIVLLDFDSQRMEPSARAGNFEILMRLRPRLVVRTSSENYQFWYCCPPVNQELSFASAGHLQKVLARRTGCDIGSTDANQQGRWPGSNNVKTQPFFPVGVHHVTRDDMDTELAKKILEEDAYQTASSSTCDVVRKAFAPPKCRGVPDKQIDRSALDWKRVMEALERDPQLTDNNFFDRKPGFVFEAARSDNQYYQRVTVQNAFRVHQGRASKDAAAKGAGLKRSSVGTPGRQEEVAKDEELKKSPVDTQARSAGKGLRSAVMPTPSKFIAPLLHIIKEDMQGMRSAIDRMGRAGAIGPKEK